MRNKAFYEDVELNHLSRCRKKYWMFYALRKEQVASRRIAARFWALMKKIILCGTGCEIPSCAISSKGGIRISHLNGIIVNDHAKIGEGCTLFHQVTIGIKEAEGIRAPIIGKNVLIGAGAKVIGPICVGDGVRIGANSVVTKDVPAFSTVVGINRVTFRERPAKIVCR